MSSLLLRRFSPLLAALFSLSLFATACGGTNVVAPTDDPETTTTQSDPDPEPSILAVPPPETVTTTSEAPVVQVTPEEIIAAVEITDGDLPASYELEIETDDSPPCDGREGGNDVFPPEAEQTLSATDEHLFNTIVTVHADEATAAESFAYNIETLTVCNGALETQDDGSQVRFEIEPTDVQITGNVDEFGSVFYRGTDAEVTVEFLLLFARKGNVSVVTFGTEAPTSIYLQELMISRLNGTDEPSSVAPVGTLEAGPGDPTLDGPDSTNPGESEGVAGEVRQLAGQILDGAPLAWIEAASDDEINALATRTCDTLADVDPDDEDVEQQTNLLFGQLWAESDAAMREALEPFDFGQVIGILMGAACPETLDLIS